MFVARIMEETSIALPDVSKRQTDDPHFAKNLKGTASHVGFKNVEVHISIILISYDLAYYISMYFWAIYSIISIF